MNAFNRAVVIYKPVQDCMIIANTASKLLKSHNVETYMFTVDDLPGIKSLLSESFSKVDLVLSIGGDGTFIRSARLFSPGSLILPYPCGRRNVYYEQSLPGIDNVLKDVLEGSFVVEYIPLCGICHRDKCAYFLNDAVIISSDLGKVSKYAVEIKSPLVNSTLVYEGDGLIISTASGSGGHNLSAKGPLLMPLLEALIITPINPLQLGLSSIVVPLYSRVFIKIRNNAYLYTDGDLFEELKREDSVEIGGFQDYIKVIRLKPVRDPVRAVFEPRRYVL